MRKTAILTFVFILISLIIFTFSCKPQSKPREKKSGTAQYDQALVLYTSGEVMLVRGTEQNPLEAGSFVKKDEVIKTGFDSSCELRIGDISLIKIEEETIVSIKELCIKAGEYHTALGLDAGAILCKVEKLLGTERFEVQTQAAVLGVRGTTFSVKNEKGMRTIVSVRQGKVSVFPSALHIISIKWAESKENKVENLLKKMEENLPIVGANEELVIENELAKRTQPQVIKINDTIKKITEAGKTDDADVVVIGDAVNSFIDIMNNYAGGKKEANPEAIEELRKMDEADILSLSDTDDQIAGEKAPEYVKIIITVNPPDAEIVFKNEIIGKAGFSGLYPENMELSFTIQKQGFKSEVLNIKTSNENRNTFTIALTPEDVKEEKESAKVDDKKTAVMENEEKKKSPIEKIISVSNTSLAGTIAVSGSTLVAADQAGRLAAFRADGKILWTKATKNNPNTNSFPVIIGNSVCFSGANELVICSIDNGKTIREIPLDGSGSHIYGRRIIPYNNYGLLPSNCCIKILDVTSGKITKEITVPGDSDMTPLFYNNQFHIINRNGILYAFSPEKREPEFSIQTEAIQPVAVAPVVFQGKLYFADRKGLVLCIDLSAKEVLWQKKLSDDKNVLVNQDVEPGGEGVFIFSKDTLYGLHAGTGEMLFTPMENISSHVLYKDGFLYAGTRDKKLLMLDPITGEVKKTLALESTISAKPCFAAGKIVCGMANGKVMVINPEAVE